MANKIDVSDIIGQTFNWLTIQSESQPHITSGGNKKRMMSCLCKCGSVKSISLSDIMSNRTKSCGCYSRIRAREKAIKRNTMHGMYGTPEYSAWMSMKKRCLNPQHHYFKHYGGRGITICESWIKSFIRFFNDMGERPSPNHSLDRIDNNNGYCKDNCRWATKKQQGRNKRSNRMLTIEQETRTLSEWSEISGLGWNTIFYRAFIANIQGKDILDPIT